MSFQVQTGLPPTIFVEFMGRPSEIFGRRLEVEIPEQGLELGALRRRLAERFAGEGGEVLLERFIRGGVGDEIATDSVLAHPGQTVFFFSPYSGG